MVSSITPSARGATRAIACKEGVQFRLGIGALTALTSRAVRANAEVKFPDRRDERSFSQVDLSGQRVRQQTLGKAKQCVVRRAPPGSGSHTLELLRADLLLHHSSRACDEDGES